MSASLATVPIGATRPSARPGPGLLHRAWYGNALPYLVTRLFAGRVRVSGAERVPMTGPVLFVGRHRAGLMDGWLYSHAVPRPTLFVIAAKTSRKRLLRPLVAGIAVMRRRDGGDRAGGNRAALLACRAELEAGRTLFICPEGTSTLGPSHLPLEPGAALLAARVPGAAIVPVAIEYVEPTRLGTDVEIEFGHSVVPDAGASAAVVQAQVAAAFRSVGADFPDAHSQRLAQLRARAAWALGRSYVAALRSEITAAAPPPAGWCAGIAAWADAPVRCLAALAGRLFADDETAVLTWAVIVGLPLQALWSIGLPVALLIAGRPGAAAVYAAMLLVRLLRRTERRRA